MSAEGIDPIEMVGRAPDERLLEAGADELPDMPPRPPEPPASRARSRVVAAGVTMTATTLLAGLALAIGGAIDGLAGSFSTAAIIALVVGIALVATHWGWVHVAELTGRTIEDRHQAGAHRARREWLAAVQPRSRWSVVSRPAADGSIVIETIHHRPVPAATGTFIFERAVIEREVHPADEAAAVVAERAETLRQRAADDTARARRRYEELHDGLVLEQLRDDAARERLVTARATSEALSEQINRHLRDPPLSD